MIAKLPNQLVDLKQVEDRFVRWHFAGDPGFPPAAGPNGHAATRHSVSVAG
jgi:hypothetical protein